ncbi:hypothetical protein SESBI_47212 [Sesbania bispinosa]|nr:hypothetical protein SESBI_47212 [Sesbania bispinosa]
MQLGFLICEFACEEMQLRGEKLLLLMSKSAKNPGRLFWRCALWDTQMSCNFSSELIMRSCLRECFSNKECSGRNEKEDYKVDG